MSYVLGQATAPSATTAALFTVPPGLCNVTFWTLGSPSLYIGTSTAVTTANGLVCHSIPTSFNSYVGSRGATFYAANTSATSTSVNYIISTDQ